VAFRILSPVIAATVLVFGSAASASAQIGSEPLLGAGISFLDKNAGATGTGFAVDLAGKVKTFDKISLAVVGDVGLNFFDFETVTMVQAGVRVNFTTPNAKVKPFAQGLAGWAHFNASDCKGSHCQSNGFVLTPGGGLDYALSKKTNLRVQLDLPAVVFDVVAIDELDHDARFWFGISFRVGG